jgi:3',5'-cyclic AMP phosphodiesterase CpdA
MKCKEKRRIFSEGRVSFLVLLVVVMLSASFRPNYSSEPSAERFHSSKACSTATAPFSFIQLCDPQLGMGGYEHDKQTFMQAVQQINSMEVDFAVICGDLVHHMSDSSLTDFQEIRSGLDVPSYLVPGNHDVRNVPDESSLKKYRETFGDDYYTFDHEGVTFIFVNTQLWKSEIGTESDKHDEWFKTTLQSKDNENRVIVTGHYPIFIQSPDEKDEYFNLPVEKRMELLTLMENHNVVAYLSGHKHEFVSNTYGSIQLVTGETTSKNFDNRPFGFRKWDVSEDTVMHHFVELEIRAELLEK